MPTLLCYEVWTTKADGARELVVAYWDVEVAWRVAGAIQETNQDLAAEVGVASGFELRTPAPGFPAERVVRTDVKGTPPA